MNPLIQLKKAIPLFLVAVACFGFSPMAQALLPPPPPDGGYPGGNTAEGMRSSTLRVARHTAIGFMRSLTTGVANSAVGREHSISTRPAAGTQPSAPTL